MQPVRRQQLVDATIAAIHEDGFGGATLSAIGRRAGLSPGIIAHYFSDKAGLLEATMRHLARSFARAVWTRLPGARSPRQRLGAILEGCFAPEHYRPEVVSAWLAFWTQVAHAPALARIQRVNRLRTESNLRHSLRALVAAPRAEAIARGLASFIDGLWLRCAMTPGGIDRAEARDLAQSYLDAELKADR